MESTKVVTFKGMVDNSVLIKREGRQAEHCNTKISIDEKTWGVTLSWDENIFFFSSRDAQQTINTKYLVFNSALLR